MIQRNMGATPEEWQWAILHLHEDILPAIGDPTAFTTATERLAAIIATQTAQNPEWLGCALAKTPSAISSTGKAHGLNGWVVRSTTYEEVKEWAKDPALNILLNTRRIRAIDIDIGDAAFADYVHQGIEQMLGVQLPCRRRANSAKRALLVQHDPRSVLVKRKVITQYGAIEFLATGQQTALFGTHPTGVRYELSHHENGIPTVPLDQLARVWDWLRQLHIGEIKHAPPLLSATDAAFEFVLRNGGVKDDPFLTWLYTNGWVDGEQPNGAVNVRCPNVAQHSTDTGPGSTTYFPIGLGGKAAGGFKCLHSHCDHIDTALFRRLVGYDEAQATAALVSAGTVHQLPEQYRNAIQPQPQPPEQLPALAHPLPAPGFGQRVEGGLTLSQASVLSALIRSRPVEQLTASEGYKIQAASAPAHPLVALERNRQGQPVTSISNTETCLSADVSAGVYDLRLDDFTDQVLLGYGTGELRPIVDDDVTTLRLHTERRYGVSTPEKDMKNIIVRVAHARRTDTAQVWLDSLEHDGRDRLSSFGVDVLRSTPSDYLAGVGWYVWVSAAARVMAPGVKADMTMVLMSPKQGTGKSSLVGNMVPFPEWTGVLNLAKKPDDRARVMAGRLVMELAELAGMQYADSEDLKAFLTDPRMLLVPKFKEFTRVMLRRCIFVGTVNHYQFIRDSTGGRRYLPVRVALTAPYLDWPRMAEELPQYWAQARDYVRRFPTPLDAIESIAAPLQVLAQPFIKQAMARDPWTRRVRDFLHQQKPGTPISLDALAGAMLSGGVSALDGARAARLRGIMATEGFEVYDYDVWLVPDWEKVAANRVI